MENIMKRPVYIMEGDVYELQQFDCIDVLILVASRHIKPTRYVKYFYFLEFQWSAFQR
jgi:hypothetical protein